MDGMFILPDWLIIGALQVPKKDWGIRISRNMITDVTSNDQLRKKFKGDEILEAPGKVLSPGFVNTHTHIY